MDDIKREEPVFAENKMGILPIKKLIITMSLPMMISMLVQALYNVVDSMFVAKISEEALTGVTLAFPLQMLMISLGSGIGVGINALLSRSLGEKNFKNSDAAANTGLFLTAINILVFLFVGLFVAEPFIKGQVKSDDAAAAAEIAKSGSKYLKICTTLSFGIFFQMTFERLLQSTGKTILSMISQGTGAIVNIIMDPILIFGLLGFPKLGVAGAAYATVLGQVIAAMLGMIMNLRYNKEINFSVKDIIKPSVHAIKVIYTVGIPSVFMMSIGSVMTFLMNQILITFSTTAATVFGIYFKLQSFFFMPVFGMNNGLIPVLAYNYGARKKERITEALSFAMKLAVSIMLVGVAVFELIPGLLLACFDASEHMLDIGIPALRIICLSFPIAGACIAMGSVFQAFSKSSYSLVISFGRQLVVLIPAAWLLSKTGHVVNVWWAFPIAEAVSLVLSLYFFKRIHRKIIDTL